MTTTAIVIVIIILLPTKNIKELKRLLKKRYTIGGSRGGRHRHGRLYRERRDCSAYIRNRGTGISTRFTLT